MNPQRYSAALAVLLMVFCLSCASHPGEALKAAQQAMDQAKQLEAAEFARADFESAQKAWDSAQKALEAQRYSEAAAQLTTARSRFEKSVAIAKAKRDDFRKELGAMQTAANQRVSTLREAVASSRATSRTRQSLNDALVEIEAAVEKINTEMLNEQLIQARASAKVALEKLDQLGMKVAEIGRKPAR